MKRRYTMLIPNALVAPLDSPFGGLLTFLQRAHSDGVDYTHKTISIDGVLFKKLQFDPVMYDGEVFEASIIEKTGGTLLQLELSILQAGGELENKTFYAKAPVAKLNDNVPATYPNATYTDENGVTQSYTYDTYKWSTGDSLPFTVGDYIYFAVSLYGGQGPAKGSEALILASDGVEIISRDAYIAARPTVEE